MLSHCIFCKIIAGQLPAQIIDQNEHVIVIKDIAPKAPVHYLIIPTEHRADIGQLQEDDQEIAAQILFMAKTIAKTQNISAFRLVSNNGSEVGQTVFHIHLHFVAGKQLEF